MIAAEADLFKVEDFDSIRINVNVRNHTSKTGVGPQARSFGDVKVPQDPSLIKIRLIELGTKGISLEAPEKIAATGHILEVSLDVAGIPLPLSLELRGKVIGIHPLEDQRERLDLDLTDYDQSLYQRLQDLFSNRQTEIDRFFAQVKR